MRAIDADVLMYKISVMPIDIGFEDVDRVEDIIKEMPTIEPERKKGKWTQISSAKIYECSVCNTYVMTDNIDCYRFCHGCGADMRGEQDD